MENKFTRILFCLLVSLIGHQVEAQVFEDFEAGYPANWTNYQTEDDDPGFVITTNQAYSGSQSIYHNDDNIAAISTAWLVTDVNTITEGVNDFLSFWYRQNYTAGFYEYSGLYISTASGDPIANPGDFVELQEFNGDFGFSEDEWTEFTLSLSSYVGEDVYLAFRYDGDFDHELFIDDFSLAPIPSCPNPTSITLDNITANSVEVNWLAGNDETEWEIVYGEPEFDPETEGETIPVTSGTPNGIITELDPETDYEVYVIAICGPDDESDYVGPVAFTTAISCPAPTGLNVSNVGVNTVDVSWNAGASETEWEIIYGEPDFDPETEGTVLEVNGTPEEEISALDGGTTYEVYVIAICGPDDESSIVGPVSFITVTLVDCSVGPVTENFCYGNNEFMEYIYTSSDGSLLNLDVNGGFLEACCDDFIVLDSNGDELFNSGGDISGQSFQTTGDQLTVIIDSDISANCQSSNYDPIDYTVSCATCINPQASYSTDCDPYDEIFSIQVDIESLGDASLLEISDNQGSSSQQAMETGMVTFGPYDYDTQVEITIQNMNDTSCTIVSPIITSNGCPPINCLEASPFCSSDGLLFQNVDNSSDTDAPEGIDYGCLNTQPNPVWYYLKIEEAGNLSLDIVQNTSFDEDGNPTGEGLDVDFIAWGPFEDIDEACGGLTVENQVEDNAYGDGCSYSFLPEETFGIENAQEGDVYVLLITNFNGDPGFIQITQSEGEGATDCSIVEENNYYGCGEELVLTATETDDLAYVWYLLEDGQTEEEPGEEIAITEEPEFTVTEPGTYYLESFDGVTAEMTAEIFYVEFSESPELNLNDEESLCGVSSLDLDATPNNSSEFGSFTYTWYQDGTELPGETTATLNVTEAGEYTVEVSGSLLDEEGEEIEDQSCTTQAIVNVTTANFTVDLGGNQSYCDDSMQDLTASVIGESADNATYTWFYNGTVITGETTNTISVNQDGIYDVEVTINGCSETQTVELLFDLRPQIDLGEDISVCDLSTNILDATPANMTSSEVTFEWSYEGEVLSSETAATLDPSNYGFGMYEVTVVSMQDPSMTCAAIEDITLSQTELNVALSTVEGMNTIDVEYCEEDGVPTQEITFNADANGEGIDAEEITYIWYMDGTEISGETSASYTAVYDESGEYNYEYEVEAYYGVSCFGSATMNTEVSIEPYGSGCSITEGLSPNEDGMNDCLDLTFLSERSGIASLKVYNRYGRIIFEQDDYTDSFCGQDQDGEALGTGTYFYILEMDNEDPVFGSTKKGWIYINQDQ